MSITNEDMEKAHEKLEKQKVVAIRPALHIVGGGGSFNSNWLHDLPVDAYFLCRPANPTPEHSRAQLMAFVIDWKDEESNAVRIHSAINEQRDYWVDSQLFSEENSLYMWRQLHGTIQGE